MFFFLIQFDSICNDILFLLQIYYEQCFFFVLFFLDKYDMLFGNVHFKNFLRKLNWSEYLL